MLFSDRVLDQLHEITVASSPKSVPNSKKQTAAQECNSLGNSFNSRWRRCSPDPNKMMMGRSPNVGDYNPRRILSTTPTRKASNSVSIERVGSPSLSGYPVSRLCFIEESRGLSIIQKIYVYNSVSRVYDEARTMAARRRHRADIFRTTSTISTSIKRIINTSLIRVQQTHPIAIS